MAMPSRTAILLNGAVALVAVASIATVGRSIVGETVASCRERYPNAVQWSLQRDNGELLTASDLQARLGAAEWGLVERATVVKVDNVHGPALMVDLARAGSRSPASQSGASFEWRPQSIGKVEAGCASFSVMFERQFAFGAGGRLPGLLGELPTHGQKAPEHFSARLSWNEAGRLGVHSQAAGGTLASISNERHEAPIPTGRWVAVDQEVILNTPGRNDGVVRVWLDGALQFESHRVSFRSTADAGIRGVLAQIAYARTPAPSEGENRIAITPFEFRW